LIRVLLADDSAFMRHFLKSLLEVEGDIRVVGVARDGEEALEAVERLGPDVVTLDVEMPRMDGLSCLTALMERHPLPVVMVSSHTLPGARATMEALARGAVDFVPKPGPELGRSAVQEFAVLLREKVRQAATVDRKRLTSLARPVGSPPPPTRKGQAESGLSRVLVIGASTGGPGALHRLLPELGPSPGCGILVVQHMLEGFTRALAEHLDRICPFPVAEAWEGAELRDGLCFVAPGGVHLLVDPSGCLSLDRSPPRHGVRPAVDVTLGSAAQFGPSAWGVILTGMGYDGVEGARKVKERGGIIVAEDASTAVVWGMPRAVVEAGLADYVLPLPQIAPLLRQMLVQEVPAAGGI
jgi:two-component system chemotaxis response regulator CheB